MAPHMPLTSGAKLGPYEIQSPLGAGGMGEVYRAKDTRLDRTVAIKTLSARLVDNPEIKQRFEREARAISALNHPNICHLYDVGSENGTDYLVMEFLEGETLADRLRKGAMPINDVVKIGIAVAEALSVAHQHGIVHRDLKPGNIMLTKTGAKLMDFGLAKSSGWASTSTSGAPPLSAVRTMTDVNPISPLTTAGTVVGTIQYMSPEQIEGKEADARSDLFALGAILYEMATGVRPFEGKSQLSVASAILEKEPEPISTVQPLTPRAFEYLIKTCLAKNTDDRVQTAHDVKLQLQWIADCPAQGSETIQKNESSRRLRKFGWIAAGLVAATLLAFLFWWRASKSAEHRTYFSAPLPFSARDIAVAPNGHTVALVGYRESERKTILWVYEPGEQEATSLPNTEGASFPFWSADGRSIGFFADGKLKKLDLAGGPVQTLCDAPTGRGGAWNKDGVILFTPSGVLGTGLYRISASGGTAEQISYPDRNQGEDSHRWPVFLPDQVHYLYLAMNLSGRKELYSIFVGSLNSSEKHLVVRSRANAAYADPGYLIFYRDQTLFAQRFDTKKFELSGDPVPLLNDIQYNPRVARAVFAASKDGLLVAQKTGDTGISQPLWLDRRGQQIGEALKPGVYGNMFLSPDGRFLSCDTTDSASQNTDVWAYDLQTADAKRLTFDPSIDSMPIWSPDGKQILFASNRELKFDLYLKDANGAQAERIIPEDGPDRFPNDWSRDGKYALYARGSDLWYVTFPDFKPSQFLKASATLKNARFSPDGKWVAYASNESGRWEIYVTSFPDAQGKWQVSNGGGDQPKWRSDGKELFYITPDGKIMATPARIGANFDSGTPAVLFQANPRELVATSEQVTYDVNKDGQKFLVNTPSKSGATPMSVVLNWTSRLH